MDPTDASLIPHTCLFISINDDSFYIQMYMKIVCVRKVKMEP